MALLIYTDATTSRFDYSVKLCFEFVTSTPHRLTRNRQEYLDYQGPKVSYTTQPCAEDAFNLVAGSDLLYRQDIEPLPLSFLPSIDEMPGALFPVPDSDLEFDLFAAVFYIATRYEEHLAYEPDKHNRFEAEQSVLYKQGWLESPMVHLWVLHFLKKLKVKFPDLEYQLPKFEYVSTVDVDTAYAYLGKGGFRTLGAYLRDLSRFNLSEITRRTNVLLGRKTDPFDTFDSILSAAEQYQHQVIFFFLVGDYDTNDKNLNHKSTKFRSLMKHISDYAIVGLHPSFASNANPKKLGLEKQRLEEVVHFEIKHSRQHFLKLHFPETYKQLLKFDIQNDYTMGYASAPGFRSGLAVPYPHFDLELNEETSLTIHPFALMEATYRYYLNKGPVAALNHMILVAKRVHQVGGKLYVTWHNDSLSNHGDWRGWNKLYFDLARSISELES